jgi:hypothetical protein
VKTLHDAPPEGKARSITGDYAWRHKRRLTRVRQFRAFSERKSLNINKTFDGF